MKITQTDIQIRFADVDILGHVNNVNLQHYFDLGKADYYRQILELSTTDPRFIITAATNTSYLAQTRPEEHIYVETWVPEIGNKSMVIEQRIKNRETGEVKAESRSVMVAYDFERQQTMPVLERWRRAIGE